MGLFLTGFEHREAINHLSNLNNTTNHLNNNLTNHLIDIHDTVIQTNNLLQEPKSLIEYIKKYKYQLMLTIIISVLVTLLTIFLTNIFQ